MKINLPPSAKLRRQMKPNGGYQLVPAYTVEEVKKIILQREAKTEEKRRAAFTAGIAQGMRDLQNKKIEKKDDSEYVASKILGNPKSHRNIENVLFLVDHYADQVHCYLTGKEHTQEKARATLVGILESLGLPHDQYDD